MRIIITDHARARIVERVGCRKDKVEKLIFKAWKFGTDPLPWFLKVFMGGAFVFVPENEDRSKLILTTCLNYDHKFKPVLPHGYKTPPPALPR